MATSEKEHGGVGPLSTVKAEKGPLGKDEKRGGRGAGPRGSRDAGFTDTDTGPGVPSPDWPRDGLEGGGSTPIAEKGI